MATEEKIKNEVEQLVDEFLTLVGILADDKGYMEFVERYQSWYTRSVKIVELLGTDRLAEFKGYYLVDPKRKKMHAGNYTIQDYVKGLRAPNEYAGVGQSRLISELRNWRV